jgi:hypothetical protein
MVRGGQQPSKLVAATDADVKGRRNAVALGIYSDVPGSHALAGQRAQGAASAPPPLNTH